MLYILPTGGPSRADFPEPPLSVVTFVPNRGSGGKYRSAVTAEPVSARHGAVARRQKLPLGSADLHPKVQAVVSNGARSEQGHIKPATRGTRPTEANICICRRKCTKKCASYPLFCPLVVMNVSITTAKAATKAYT